MFRKHITRHLSAYHHGELPGDEKLRVEAHLRECAHCRRAYDEVRLGAQLASSLSLSEAPESTWNDLLKLRSASSPPSRPSRRQWIPRAVFAGLAAAAVIVIVGIFSWNSFWRSPAWEVTGLPGTPRLRAGQVLETDSSSTAQVKVANIGQITVDPNTRIRLLVTRSSEHRIALEHGRLEAATWAPPRLFIVETPSATAVDLGCKYTLEVEDDGSSLLHVILGLVALERGGRETIVPAGAFCRTLAAPGTPFFEDSSERFQSALRDLDSGVVGAERARQLEITLQEARVRDALSLWHLLPRLDPESRGLIYDRLAQLLPPPSGVTRDGIIALDRAMLDSWKKVVSQLWQ
ncbi:MAG TPA: zf-HC2 domain-containing protein [Terriglobia bacterium]|nr:zf-HC2 domain-containing protein [Terriglobia bacterium]